MITRLIVIITLLCGSTAQAAKNLYVDGSDATCSDSVTYANNADTDNNRWCTIGRAAWGSTDRDSMVPAQAAAAGDVVIIEPGTYTMSGLNNWAAPNETASRSAVVYNPANSGTSGNYITFRANGAVILETSAYDNSSSTGQPTIGADSRDYISWDGFYIDEADADTRPDTGPVVVWDSSYIEIKNCQIVGTTSTWGDNHNGIRLEYSDYVTIHNNLIHGFVGNWSTNESAIATYDAQHVTISNNTLYADGTPTGMYLKGARIWEQGDFIIKNNLLYGFNIAMYVRQVNRVDLHNNIIRDSAEGIRIVSEYNGDFSPGSWHVEDSNIVNNTLDNLSSMAVYVRNSDGGCSNIDGNIIRNNLISNSVYSVYSECPNSAVIASKVDFDTNNYYSTNAFTTATGSYTFSTWQSTVSQDANSTTANPLFEDIAGEDYHLTASSPVDDTGVDVLDLDNDGSTIDAVAMGAYVTGLETIGYSTTPPTPVATTTAYPFGSGTTIYGPAAE